VLLSTTATYMFPTKAEREAGGKKTGAARLLSSATGVTLVLSIFLSLLFSRYMLFDLLVMSTGQRPSEVRPPCPVCIA
jgi:hypothetical protein